MENWQQRPDRPSACYFCLLKIKLHLMIQSNFQFRFQEDHRICNNFFVTNLNKSKVVLWLTLHQTLDQISLEIKSETESAINDPDDNIDLDNDTAGAGVEGQQLFLISTDLQNLANAGLLLLITLRRLIARAWTASMVLRIRSS